MPRKKISGVYIITCTVNNKHYIGESGEMNRRLTKHLCYLRANTHKNEHLQRAFNKYGENYFIFETLIECSPNIRKSEEHYWCNLLNVHDRKHGYNTLPTSPHGRIGHSEETKKKLSIVAKGRGKGIKKAPFTEEHKRNLSKSKMGNTAFKGKKHTIESIEKLRKIHKGKMYHPPVKHSDETKKKLSEMKKGKPLSEEHKIALRKSRERKYYENEFRLEQI